MRTSTLAFAVLALTVALAACEKRDPLFCEMNGSDPRCLAGGDGGVVDGQKASSRSAAPSRARSAGVSSSSITAATTS